MPIVSDPSCGVTVGDTVSVFTNCTSGRIRKLLSLGSYLFLTSVDYPSPRGEVVHQVKNLQNRIIVAAAVDQPSFYHSVKFRTFNSSIGVDEFEGGINVEAFRFLRDSLQFQESALKSRGQMNADEKGELQNLGIAQVLNSDEADIAISLYELLPYRLAGPHGVRFLHDVFKSSKAIAVFTQPPKNSARNVYGLPFHLKVWAGVWILYAVFILIIWLLLAVFKRTYGERSLSILEMLRHSHFWMLCVLTRQGFFEKSFQTTYIRITLLTGFISSVIFHSSFSSALTSILAQDYQPITSFSQLIANKYTMYYDKYVPSIKIVLQDSSHIAVVEMGSDIELVMRSAAPKIFKSEASLLTSEDRFYPFFNSRYHDSFLCKKLSRVPLMFTSIRSANFVKLGSPYRDIFNIKFLQMQQSGLIERLYREHTLKSTLTCLPSFDSEFLRLDFFDTAFLFLILLHLSCLSVLFLTCEILIVNHYISRMKTLCCGECKRKRAAGQHHRMPNGYGS